MHGITINITPQDLIFLINIGFFPLDKFTAIITSIGSLFAVSCEVMIVSESVSGQIEPI